MKTDAPLKWKLKLTVELAAGECMERDVAEWKRGAEVDLASLGLSTEEGKNILAEIQAQMVKLQVERHGEAHRCCDKCGRKRRNKGHYRSTFRSLYGNVAGAGPAGENLSRLRREARRSAIYAQILDRSGTAILKRKNWRL